MKNDRISYMDIFRGLGIVFMIMGHVGFGNKFDYFIHAFHMPMFFFVSGFFWSDKIKEFSKFVQKKTKNLIVPYFVFGIVQYFIWLLMNWNNKSFDPLYHLLFINTLDLPIAGALWFLTALYFAEIFYFIINKCIKNNIIKYTFIALIAVVGCIISQLCTFKFPYAIDVSFVGLGFVCIGNLFKQNINNKIIEKSLNLSVIECMIGGGVVLIMITMNGYINMRMGRYSCVLLFWINAINSIVIGINISKKLENFQSRIFIKIIKKIGRDSITYVALNQLAITLLVIFLSHFNIVWLAKICPLLVTITTIAIIWMVDYVINSTKLKILLGKF